MTKRKATTERWPQHKDGERCGYELYEDGSIRVAPTYSDQMDDVISSEVAVDSLLASVSRESHQLLAKVHAAKQRFWDEIGKDYGLDFDKFLYSYNRLTKIISRKPKGTPPEIKPQAPQP